MYENSYAPADFGGGDQWSVGLDDVGTRGASAPGPHVTLAGMLFLLIGLKAFTESNLISADLAEIKLSLINIVKVLAITLPGIVGFKILTVKMVEKGIALPGQAEVAAAI